MRSNKKCPRFLFGKVFSFHFFFILPNRKNDFINDLFSRTQNEKNKN